jgi:hypothetical protein
MIAVEFKESNCVFGKPVDMTDEQCLPLSVWRGNCDDGTPEIISCWKLSKEDLEEINKTGTIWLRIIGQGMPPVSLQTETPFIQL